MALPLVILLVLVGFVFVGVGAYVVKNLFWSSQATVVQAKLYNAAQSGAEWGIAQLWDKREQIEWDPLLLATGLEDLLVRKDNAGEGTGNEVLIGPTPPPVDPSISVEVKVLDCNYNIATSFTPTPSDRLPPRILGAAEGSGPGTPTFPEGTSVIIDPSHFINLGGGAKEHHFVVRSKATGYGRKVEIEAMVVISR